jgi:hypothetical protein
VCHVLRLAPRVRIFSISVKTKQMSAPTSAIVAPTKGGAPDMAAAAGVQKMAGGMMLSPLPLGGGKRKTRKISKKVKAMLKKMTPKQLKKMMKGGEPVEGAEGGEGAEGADQEGARRRRRSRRSSRKSRARKFY